MVIDCTTIQRINRSSDSFAIDHSWPYFMNTKIYTVHDYVCLRRSVSLRLYEFNIYLWNHLLCNAGRKAHLIGLSVHHAKEICSSGKKTEYDLKEGLDLFTILKNSQKQVVKLCHGRHVVFVLEIFPAHAPRQTGVQKIN